jgi:phosphoribosylformimino-5-aminoimidazole carboxamide ribotide isomerase
MYIIPAIDILNKKVVRLREGDYKQVTEYDVTLEEMIDRYQSNGTNFIHIIDLNGAKNDFSNQQYLFDVIRKTDMQVQYGGGIRSIDKVKELLDAGVHRVIVGTQRLLHQNLSLRPHRPRPLQKKYSGHHDGLSSPLFHRC